jgi:hypothetical protein
MGVACSVTSTSIDTAKPTARKATTGRGTTVLLLTKADHHTARARVATAEEKPELSRIMTATGAPYDEFQLRPTASIDGRRE